MPLTTNPIDYWRTARYPALPDAPLNKLQAERANYIIRAHSCMGCQFYRDPANFSSQCMAAGDPLLSDTTRRWDNTCADWQARPVFVAAAWGVAA
jgi:hypothetical protein